MSYSEFTLHSVQAEFGIQAHTAVLFETVQSAAPPAWLREHLARGLELSIATEKARSELIVMPVLLGLRGLSGGSVAIYSGQRLDVDAAAGLTGECDFILARTDPLPELSAPIAVVVEAKKHELETGMGQCAAQMIGARKFNELANRPMDEIYGSVTNGDVWQFLRLRGNRLDVDPTRYYLGELDRLLGVLKAISLP